MAPRVITNDHRVVLRTFEDADADAMLAVLGDPEVMRFSTTGIATIDDCHRFITESRAIGEQTGLTAWAICTPADLTARGYCRLRGEAEWIGEDEIEIGYRLATDAWGQGLATAAGRLAERLGMKPIRELMLPEYDHPDIVYAVHPPGRR